MILLRYSGCHWIVLILFLLAVTPAGAGEWEIVPRISVAEIYSDNINLDDDDKDYDLVTEISPGISIHGEGARVRANLDYQMQNAFFLRNSDGDNIFQQMNADGNVEMARDLLFVDASSRIGQAVVDADNTIANNNLNNGGNRTDFYSYRLSPYILPRFGSFADGNARYTYSSIKYDEGASDAVQNRFDAGLVSGRYWGPLSWSASYYKDDLNRDTSSNDKREASRGDARYQINNFFSLVAQGGYENNDYQSSNVIFNGSYWAAGFFLQPSRFYSIEALTGNNLTTVTASLYPTARTALIVNYRNQDVGTTTGDTWAGTFRHRTRRTNWNASYSEDTTTQQIEQITEDVIFSAVDPLTGDPITNPQPGDFNTRSIGPVLSLTDEAVERKLARGSVGMRTGRTGLLFSVFDIKRKFLSSLTEEETKGFSGSIDRQLASRTNLVLSGTWQLVTTQTDDTERYYWFLQTRLGRQISRRLDGSVFYRFSAQEEGNGRRGYQENRIEARLTAFF